MKQIAESERLAALAAVQSTIDELQSERQEWESDVRQLFDDFDSLAVQLAMEAAADGVPHARPFEECWLELAAQQEQFSLRQSSATAELSSIREMISQQTELLTAFMGAATRMNPPNPPAKRPKQSDPVVAKVQTQFEQLAKLTGEPPDKR